MNDLQVLDTMNFLKLSKKHVVSSLTIHSQPLTLPTISRWCFQTINLTLGNRSPDWLVVRKHAVFSTHPILSKGLVVSGDGLGLLVVEE